MFYKYLSSNRLNVIDNFMIRFTQPADLNDPFESALLVDPGVFLDMSKTIEDFQADAVAEGLIPKNDEEQAVLDATINDLKASLDAAMKPEALGKVLVELINKAQGVLSLSRTNDSLLMWAHYCESHKGYVIGLDESHPFFSETDSKGRPTKPHNVIYTSKRIIANAGSDDFYEKLLCYKSLEWAYEQEVRIFRTFGKNTEDFKKNTNQDVHLFALPRNCIKEIYIGANASITTRKRILEVIDRRKLSVRLFEAYVTEDRYALDFREVVEPLYSYRPQEFLTLNLKQSTCYLNLTFSYANVSSQRRLTLGKCSLAKPVVND